MLKSYPTQTSDLIIRLIEGHYLPRAQYERSCSIRKGSISWLVYRSTEHAPPPLRSSGASRKACHVPKAYFLGTRFVAGFLVTGTGVGGFESGRGRSRKIGGAPGTRTGDGWVSGLETRDLPRLLTS